MRAIELLRTHLWEKAVCTMDSNKILGYINLRKKSELRCTRCNLGLDIYFWSNGVKISWWCGIDNYHWDYISPLEELSIKYNCKYQLMQKALR